MSMPVSSGSISSLSSLSLSGSLVPKTLSLYFCRRFLASFATIMAGLLSIVYLAEMLELLRRAASHSEVGFSMVLTMAALKMPGTIQVLLPSAVLFTALHFFWSMTKTHELEVTRAAGVSVWNFLAPVVMTALFLGVIDVTVVNPLSSAMAGRFERMEEVYLRNQATSLKLSSSGIWISQSSQKKNGVGGDAAFIHADSIAPDSFTLHNVTIFVNPSDIKNGHRIDADSARLAHGAWELTNAYIHTAGGIVPTFAPTATFPTELTPRSIEESFAPPATISFWKLPAFIDVLEAAGLSSTRHSLYFNALIARPFLLAAMVILAAVFGLRQNRRGGVFATIVLGLGLGLLLFILNDVLQTFAASGGMPVFLAAWGPALVGLTGAAAALFYSEDG